MVQKSVHCVRNKFNIGVSHMIMTDRVPQIRLGTVIAPSVPLTVQCQDDIRSIYLALSSI